MKSDNPTIDTLVVITDRRLLNDDISLDLYGQALSRGIEKIKQNDKAVEDLEKGNWMGRFPHLYILCRDTELPFEEYLQLCDTIGSTVVYHGKVITNREQLRIVLEKAKRIHLPTNLIRYWQSEQQELWNTLQQRWAHVELWSTIHDEEDVQLLTSLRIPNLECVLISPIFLTPCKEGHPGIGVSRG